jgi:hypothetical protein
MDFCSFLKRKNTDVCRTAVKIAFSFSFSVAWDARNPALSSRDGLCVVGVLLGA